MPIYHRLGDMPRKRHSVFRRPDGALYVEELVGNKGFVGPSSLLYHIAHPTRVLRTEPVAALHWPVEEPAGFEHRHFRTAQMPPHGTLALHRVPLLVNDDVAMSVATPAHDDEHYYRNAQGDEVLYMTDGAGVLETQMGELDFASGDYLVIPRGILYRVRFASHPARCLVIESRGYVRTPRRYRNEHGQLLEDAPFSERDIRPPTRLPVVDQRGEHRVIVKKDNRLTAFVLDHHPLDVVGWDGYYYPWAFSIHDFEPRVGRFHLPPPIHQTFEGEGFVICSFCPRPYDFDPTAVPAPYVHSNVMSDEVLYYASSEFMSRRGIEYGSVTLHPDGVPHGPHPGRTEASIGQTHTDELAVMLDTFRPLRVATDALPLEDRTYMTSWID